MNLSFEEWRGEIERLAVEHSTRYHVSFDNPAFLTAYREERTPEWAFRFIVVTNAGALLTYLGII